MEAKSVIGLLAIFATLTIASANVCTNVNGKGLNLNVGEAVSVPGQCTQVTCMAGGSVSGKGCALYQPPPGYTFSVIKYDLPFPDCCPREIPKVPEIQGQQQQPEMQDQQEMQDMRNPNDYYF